MGYVTWPRPFQGCFVIRRLGLVMFNPYIKFEVSNVNCNEEMTGNDATSSSAVADKPARRAASQQTAKF